MPNALNEQDLHDSLYKFFTQLEDGQPHPTIDPDGQFSFVVVGFCKPSSPDRLGAENTRLNRAGGVSSMMAMVAPDVDINGTEESELLFATLTRSGVHSLCAGVCMKYLGDVALPVVIREVQKRMALREGHLDD